MDRDIYDIVMLLLLGLPFTASALWGISHTFLKHQRLTLNIQAKHTAEKAAQYAAQTERLEQRVRVLERIVTEKGIVVADEIEKLRGEPLN